MTTNDFVHFGFCERHWATQICNRDGPGCPQYAFGIPECNQTDLRWSLPTECPLVITVAPASLAHGLVQQPPYSPRTMCAGGGLVRVGCVCDRVPPCSMGCGARLVQGGCWARPGVMCAGARGQEGKVLGGDPAEAATAGLEANVAGVDAIARRHIGSCKVISERESRHITTA